MNAEDSNRTYSYGHSPGFSPGSLFKQARCIAVLFTINSRKITTNPRHSKYFSDLNDGDLSILTGLDMLSIPVFQIL